MLGRGATSLKKPFSLGLALFLAIAVPAQVNNSTRTPPQTTAYAMHVVSSYSQSVGSGTGALNGKRPFRADYRLTATLPDNSVKLAQPVQVVLHLADANPAAITVVEHQSGNRFENESGGLPVGSGAAKIINDNGQVKTIEVVPLQVGLLDIDITAIFIDGGIAHGTYHLKVIPASDGLKHFYIHHGGHYLAIVLEDRPDERQIWLAPEAYYNQLDYPIYLADSLLLNITVEQPNDDPVIQLDSNGLIHGLRPGRAKVTSKFDGVADSVIVNVYSKENAPIGYRRLKDWQQTYDNRLLRRKICSQGSALEFWLS